MGRYSTPDYEKTHLFTNDIITASNDKIVVKENDGIKITHSINNIFK